MNTVQTSQEKRTIKVKDFLDDFHGGMPDGELLKRYHLTPAGLEKFYSMLLDRHILGSQELLHHYKQRESAPDRSSQRRRGESPLHLSGLPGSARYNVRHLSQLRCLVSGTDEQGTHTQGACF